MIEHKKPKENIILEEALAAEEIPRENIKEKKLTEQLQRLQAEFQNFQKRTEKEKQNTIKNANEKIILDLLEVLDNFELSLKHSEDKGVALIYDDLKRILKREGLEVVKIDGKFNPKFHEAMLQEEGKEEGTILEELQKGYLLNDKLLRASKVKISKKKN